MSKAENEENEESHNRAMQSEKSTSALSQLMNRGLRFTRKAVKATYRSEAGLDIFLKARKSLFKRGEFVFISAMPKSGSSFLSKSIVQITGFDKERMTYAFERNEQELYPPKLVDNYNRPTVTQQHTRATSPNIYLLNRFEIRPVILVRNIFDVVFSIRDYLLKEGVALFPSLYATDHFSTLPEDKQYDFLITFAVPWYFNFYASWFDAARDNRIETLWLTYENLVNDWAFGIGEVLAFYNIEHSEEDIRSAVNNLQRRPAETRMNKGVVGRGQEGLTEVQKERIIAMKQFYPWVDFSRMGL